MVEPSHLLIELLDGLGAHEADAALRVRALRGAGCVARTLVLESGVGGAAPSARRALLKEIAAHPPTQVWVAGARDAWQALAPALGQIPAAWWPTILAGSGAEPAVGSDAALPLAAGAPTTGGECVALDLAPVRVARERAPVALWDGDFVLVPGPLRGLEAERLLGAFAMAAAERPEIELVVLADAEPHAAAVAHALELTWRVHFAGVTPREAEHTWLATASAVLLPMSQPVSAGLILRALAAGTPIITDGVAPGAQALDTWLGDSHGAPGCDAPQALGRALARDPRLREACLRGRARSAVHEPDALALRLRPTRLPGRTARKVA